MGTPYTPPANDLFVFENGLSAGLYEVPVEFHPFFTAIAQTAPDFHCSVEWDSPSLASLLVLQMLRTKLEKPAGGGNGGGMSADADGRRDSKDRVMDRVEIVALALTDGFANKAAIEKLYGERASFYFLSHYWRAHSMRIIARRIMSHSFSSATYVNALKEHCCDAVVPQRAKLSRIVNHVSAFLPFRTIGFTCLQAAVNAGCPLTANLVEIHRCSGLALQTYAIANAAASSTG